MIGSFPLLSMSRNQVPSDHRVWGVLFGLMAWMPIQAAAEVERPLWEVGAGLAALSFPAYRGSDQRHEFAMPVPYFNYNGKFIKADRHGVRGQLFDSEWVDLTLSAAASPPASSKKIIARQGMPDLQATVELGPQVDVMLWHSDNRSRSLKLLLPWRAGFTLEKNTQHTGWVFHPKLNLDIAQLPALPAWNVGLLAGPVFADQRQHHHFYGVASQYATAERPQYTASAGYGGMQYLASLSRRYDKHWVGAFVRFDQLNGARFADSPLVRTKDYWSAGIAVSWIFGASQEKVLVDD